MALSSGCLKALFILSLILKVSFLLGVPLADDLSAAIVRNRNVQRGGEGGKGDEALEANFSQFHHGVKRLGSG